MAHEINERCSTNMLTNTLTDMLTDRPAQRQQHAMWTCLVPPAALHALLPAWPEDQFQCLYPEHVDLQPRMSYKLFGKTWTDNQNTVCPLAPPGLTTFLRQAAYA